MTRRVVTALFVLTFISSLAAQTVPRDHGVFTVQKNEFLDSMKAASEKFLGQETAEERTFRLDFSSIDAPPSVEAFTRLWHLPPVSQGISGMCWCFSATSFYESEIHRLTKRTIKLSELYTVYWEYVEKAREWVRTRGTSYFGQGSESNAVPRIWKVYGIVPAEAYTGLKPGQTFHNHDPMFEEMQGYLNSVKEQNAWNEGVVLTTIRSILDNHIGSPPEKVTVNGVSMTPQEYLRTVVRLDDPASSAEARPFRPKVGFLNQTSLIFYNLLK